MMSKQTHHSRQPHTLSSMPMSLGWTLYFYFLHLLFLLFLLLALSAPLPWSVHCKHQSAPSTSINQLAFPFSRSVRQHHSHNHNHIQWPLSVAQRSLHNPFTPNSSYDKNVKRFSTERKSKHNGSRHQSRQRKVKPKTSINSGGQVPSWAQSGAGQHSSNISLLLDQLLLGYDSHVRPNFGGSALEVQVDMHIRRSL